MTTAPAAPIALVVIQPCRQLFQPLTGTGSIPTTRQLQPQLQLQQLHRQAPGLLRGGQFDRLLQQLVGLAGLLLQRLRFRQQLRCAGQPPCSGQTCAAAAEQHIHRRLRTSGRRFMLSQLHQAIAAGKRLAFQSRQVSLHQPPQCQRRLAVIQRGRGRLPAQQQPGSPFVSLARAVAVEHHPGALRRTAGHQGPGIGQHQLQRLGRGMQPEQSVAQLLQPLVEAEIQGITTGLLQSDQIPLQQQLLKLRLRHRSGRRRRNSRHGRHQRQNQRQSGHPHGGLRFTKETYEALLVPPAPMAMSTARPSTLPELQRLLVVGGGGREHALAWALGRCPGIETVWVSPGNGGSGPHQAAVAEDDAEGLIHHCREQAIDLVVVGPEAPLAAGVADALRAAGLAVFGPGADGALLEASKAWAKQLMQDAGVPTAGHWAVDSEAQALAVLEQVNRPLVVKADGLAAGKGVTVADTVAEAEAAIRAAFAGRFGNAGSHLVLEERLSGPEVSVFALSDGERLVLLPTAQDHKRLEEGDKGPNTGGMGAYAPAPLLDATGLEQVRRSVLEPTLAALRARGIDYRGVIYAGLMLTDDGPQVIEFNCRFGDPECQTLMPLLGPELARVLQACALGRLDLAPELSISAACSACVVAAAAGYPESPRKGDPIRLNLITDEQRQLFHAGTSRDAAGALHSSGGRVLAVVAQGDSFDAAFAKAYSGLEQVDFEGITYRRDIGHQVRTDA